ncbi:MULTISPECIES: FtsW/RodA/SpoVE family cell cycle protein [Streptococcus]|uniref:Cell cycle protein, FtsW/RodA/SpoVE family n=1 Tax=Streptococcus infantis SK1076 TaxID=1005705 RepID=F5VYJ0_9STRE|nr:FtsW/RodA/SpoVE family cell cycle protein [Streptococcus infantis]EGL87986.1 cell cycle protein, FtsW/RodA/SpoVE family [Streptococcus infantis SK1076]MCP9057071.1 FtsW/RodA/SpoVE family cell cycle protein [Streptococcus infantis]MCP9081367.1 FtsW/RodA/SpoVE family cell cycle protein [Streptococcus infantis]UJD04128.1 rod shape-determining protein RodA [Streptococcus infantis]
MKRSFDSRVDYSLILPVFCLLVIGVVAIYIAVSHDYPNNVWPILGQQLAWIALGIIFSFVVMFFNTKFLWQSTPYLYGLGLALMVLPLVFYNPSLVAATGAKNWVSIGGYTLFQPSEFMKISYILMLAYVIVTFTKKYKDQARTIGLDFLLILWMIVFTIPVLVLLALQSDLGTAMVFVAIFAGLVLLSGVSWKIIIPVFVTVVSAITGFLAIFITKDGRAFMHQLGMPTYQINRILAWLNPFDYAQTTTYQQAQGQIAIGSGGVFGQGFNVSNLLIPVRESDMIFTVIAEDFGFIGSVVVIALYLLLIYRMLKITLKSNNQFYTYISTGFIMMLLFHIFENIGAVTGLLPLTGIPLPFISQGGSAIISNLIGVGLLLSMSYQTHLADEKSGRTRFKRKKVVLKKVK